MKRHSTTTKLSDSAGDYEQEIFGYDSPKRIIIGVHGVGVRRWDGEKFYYQVAEHFTDSVIVLVDQNQVEGGGCKLNSIDIMVERNQKALGKSAKKYPGVPLWVLGHSMGCGVSSMLNVSNVDGMIFVAPAVGSFKDKYAKRYGKDIVNGKIVTSSDGFKKNISKEFIQSVWDIKWQDNYTQLLDKFSPIHVFESGDDEIVDEERFELRDMPFTSYSIVENAKHNFSGKYSEELFAKIEKLL